ncbi:MAG: hypothetical protein K2N48_10635 [Muribaculaceae bacterium]|nr:hypothetical protein [Muribaculaceae bacterium]
MVRARVKAAESNPEFQLPGFEIVSRACSAHRVRFSAIIALTSRKCPYLSLRSLWDGGFPASERSPGLRNEKPSVEICPFLRWESGLRLSHRSSRREELGG